MPRGFGPGVRHDFGRMNSLATRTQNLPSQVGISVCESEASIRRTLCGLVGAISPMHSMGHRPQLNPKL